VIRNLFKSSALSLQIYGSCASGLALASSDVDLALVGFGAMNDKEECSILASVRDHLKVFGWVLQATQVVTANVSVLIIEVDLNQGFTSLKDKLPTHTYVHQIAQNDFFDLEPGATCPRLKLDITLMHHRLVHGEYTPFHSGIISTQKSQGYLAWHHPHLYSLVLVLKQFLRMKGFNKAFEGGLSSYYVLVMTVAFLRRTPKQLMYRNEG